MLRIIKVEEIGMYGFESETKFFKSLKKAKKYFKELIKKHKEDLAEIGDCSSLEKPIEYYNYKKNELFIEKPTGRNKIAKLECWYSSETDCGTEYDTEVITIYLNEIKIEG